MIKQIIVFAIVVLAPDAPGSGVPANTAIPQIKGLDFPDSGNKLTLAIDSGQWTNSPTSFAYNWRTVSGSNLGSGPNLSLKKQDFGQAIVVDVTATNSLGSATQSSHWFGPISDSAPIAPVENETLPGPVEAWPTEPARFLENGHAIFPGCDIPPIAPTATGDHVWVFDPINGKTQADGATGHPGSPFKDIGAIFNGLFPATIKPGDTIVIKPGDADHPLGDLLSTSARYSTEDGTSTGKIKWTWIVGEGAPVLHRILFQNGAAGFIIKGLNVEQYRENNTYPVLVTGSIAAPAHDIHFENMSVSGWLGHSRDPWEPSHYPTSGGLSDGTVRTASPNISPSAPQDPATPIATAPKGSTRITLNAAAKVGDYIWSPGYYRTAAVVSPTASGIPNGTKVVAMNGLEATIAPCDPAADAATGCPTEPIPGCDPIVMRGQANCSAPWSGTTRALNGERVSLTDSMKILPAGWFNSTDWDMAGSSGFRFAGQLDRAGSVDPANPNLLKGAKCLSVKDSMVRWFYNGVQTANVMNSVIYNNKIKWMSGDFFPAYTTNRVWYVHNRGSDTTLIWAHQDGIQFGDTNGNVAIKYYYNNAVIENEFLQATDDTNPFPRPMQGVTTTENYHWGMYVCCNVIKADNNALRIAGKWGVVAHNTVLGNATVVEHQRKTQGGIPQDLSATHHLLANNVGNGVGRDSAIPNYCNPQTGDLNQVEGNISLPFSPTTSASQVYCDKEGVGKWNAAMGVFQGLKTWSLTDWKPMFSGLHPNPDFEGFAGEVALTTLYAQWLPGGQPDGAYAVVSAPGGQGESYAPAGVWEACASCSTNANGARVPWRFVQPDFNPGVIGAGVNLGPQQPIADLDGKAWADPPTAGAYENR